MRSGKQKKVAISATLNQERSGLPLSLSLSQGQSKGLIKASKDEHAPRFPGEEDVTLKMYLWRIGRKKYRYLQNLTGKDSNGLDRGKKGKGRSHVVLVVVDFAAVVLEGLYILKCRTQLCGKGRLNPISLANILLQIDFLF